MSGLIIVINGGSSAGKSSIVRELQNMLPDLWLGLGIDASILTTAEAAAVITDAQRNRRPSTLVGRLPPHADIADPARQPKAAP
jgi:chloramphenicol 3-O-phosphotransferase